MMKSRSKRTISSGGKRGWKGSSLIYLICALVALLGLASLGVDWSVVQITKQQLYNALDAASLAAAAGLPVSPAQVRANAETFAQNNKVNGLALVLQDSDIVLGTWNPTTKTFTALSSGNESNATAVQVTGQLSTARGNAVPLWFASLFGVKYAQMSHTVIAGYAAAADIMVVQDLSQSFSTVLSSAKQGDQALLDSLNSSGGLSYFGLVAMTGWGQTISSFQTITGNYTTLTNAVSSLNQCGSSGMPVCSGSDMAAGFIEALNDFNSPSYPHYTYSNIVKAIVYVTDGAPNSSSNGSHSSLSDSQLLTLAQQEADAAWAQGINVYGVFYNPNNDTTGATNLQSLVRGKGILIQVTQASQLPAALASITQQLPMSILK